MSDSDLADSGFTFQNEGSIVSANGPNININNLTGLSFRNNDLTSTMNIPSIMSRKNDWPRRPGSNYNQRTMWGRRETSPMSTASACDMRQRNYNNVFYSRALSSQRMNSERALSPTMSLRSINSKASNVSAVDIITAIKHFRGSSYDKKKIQDACKHTFMKRAGIEKRRNLRVFLKGYRRKSGYDSGELGSNSSSSDDDRSTRAPNYKDMSSCRSTKTDIADFRRNIKDTNMVKDCTNNFRQNKTLSMVNGSTKLNSRSLVSPSRSMIDKSTIPKLSSRPPVTNINITHNQSSMNQSKCYGDRFKNKFILPSQRFNQSIAATSIAETSFGHSVPIKHPINNPRERISDDDEIFSASTSREKPTSNLRKRSIDGNDDIISLPNNKKPKVDIVQKDFEFAKPACPVRKVSNAMSKEIVISTSTNMNPTEKLISKSASLPPILNISEAEDKQEDNTELQITSQNDTDVSMRPSFMKRKLFSQNMDVTEKINDMANSPQNSVYGKIQKEKNKARKLVTSQYCLSRDIQSDENNLLDLIHKIVPAECMNATAQSKKSITQNKSADKVNGDVTSIVSVRNSNEGDLSDTFTDEDALIDCNGEIFSPKTVKKVCKSPQKNVQKSPQKPPLEKSPVKKVQKSLCKDSKLSQNVLAEKNGTPTKGVEKMEKYIKSFWDTDFESDVEFTPASRKGIDKKLKENNYTDAAHSVGYKPAFQGISSINPVNNATMINTTVDSTQKFNYTNSMFKLCSHRDSKPKKIACEKVNATQIEPISSEQKNTKSNICPEVTELENDTQPANKKPDKPKPEKQKPEKKKSPLKKQSKAKSVKNNNTNVAKDKECKTINGINDKILGEENTKTQEQKTKNMQSKKESKDGLDKNNIKKGATVSQNKIENNIKKQNKAKQTRHDKVSQNLIKNKPQINEASKSQKPDLKDKNINNKTPNTIKKYLTRLSDSLIYEDSFTETNNYSNRPIRSCRLSKQNSSLDISKVNQTLNVTLRSRQKKTDEKKPDEKKPNEKKLDKKNPAAKISKSKDQSNLSNLSLSVAQNKPITSIKSRLRETKKIDCSDSDISFSLTDKDSHLKSRGKSAKFIKHAQTLTDRGMPNIKEFVSKEPRPVRTSRLNKRYFS